MGSSAVAGEAGGALPSRSLRIFLDANVLFSAARSAGAMRAVLYALDDQDHRLVADEYVCTEARRNLLAKAGAEALQTLVALLAKVELLGTRDAITPARAQAAQWLPDKDRPVLLAAMALRCEAMVTGDKTHFGAGYGQRFGGVMLVSPAQLALAVLAKRD
jgi:predicted nucleic acid-binding protein